MGGLHQHHHPSGFQISTKTAKLWNRGVAIGGQQRCCQRNLWINAVIRWNSPGHQIGTSGTSGIGEPNQPPTWCSLLIPPGDGEPARWTRRSRASRKNCRTKSWFEAVDSVDHVHVTKSEWWTHTTHGTVLARVSFPTFPFQHYLEPRSRPCRGWERWTMWNPFSWCTTGAGTKSLDDRKASKAAPDGSAAWLAERPALNFHWSMGQTSIFSNVVGSIGSIMSPSPISSETGGRKRRKHFRFVMKTMRCDRPPEICQAAVGRESVYWWPWQSLLAERPSGGTHALIQVASEKMKEIEEALP